MCGGGIWYRKHETGQSRTGPPTKKQKPNRSGKWKRLHFHDAPSLTSSCIAKGPCSDAARPFRNSGDVGGLVPKKKNKNLIVVSLDGLEGMEVEFFEGGGIFSVLPAGDVCEVLVIAGAFTGGRLVFGSEVAPA